MSIAIARDRVWLKPASIATIALAALTGLTGCQSGPAEIADGSYQLLATSTATTAEASQTAEIDGSTITLHTTSGDATATMGSPGSDFVLCPPNGRGRPVRLGNDALTVDRVILTRPAIFGSCGSTTPERITLVDLDGVDGGMRFPFTRWAEFCLTGSKDCYPASVHPGSR
jgi:hypothetical protein